MINPPARPIWSDVALRLEIMRNALSAIADEMSITLSRAAYSTNIKTRLDYSCALHDRVGRVVAQAMNQPIHLGSLAHFVPRIIESYGEDQFLPGDGVLCNDGHLGGLHLNDVCLVTPFFWEGQLVGYISSMAHHVDVGGGTPGSMGLHEEIFQEGLIVPPTLFISGGKIVDSSMNLILANVRSPAETGGDLRAQVASANLGQRRFSELLREYGPTRVWQSVHDLFDYTERRVRAQLDLLPDVTLAAEDYLDDDGVGGEPVRICVSISRDDTGVVFDLAGTDTQRPSSINTTYAMTYSTCAYALRALLDPDLPMNDGFYRVLRVKAPAGTVVNATRPAAIGVGIEVGHRVIETAFKAFAKAIPDRLAADTKGSSCNIGFGGIDPRSGKYFVFYETLAGGYGGRSSIDGIDAIQPHAQNTENSPVEETEANYPIVVVRYQLIPNSEGAGRQRGGLGLRRDYLPEGEITFTVMADRSRFAPQGLAGGGAGAPSVFVVNPDGHDERMLGSKFSLKLAAGEILSCRTAGGGGFGPSWDREVDAVLNDVIDGRITPQRAEHAYGVVLRGSRVNPSRTAALRELMRAH